VITGSATIRHMQYVEGLLMITSDMVDKLKVVAIHEWGYIKLFWNQRSLLIWGEICALMHILRPKNVH
jgi:hypothetical protein